MSISHEFLTAIGGWAGSTVMDFESLEALSKEELWEQIIALWQESQKTGERLHTSAAMALSFNLELSGDNLRELTGEKKQAFSWLRQSFQGENVRHSEIER